ncbi:MAG TPA: VOC family protein [Gemmatimonadales bacterium]|nr:VOC family protein [Gemmatimonadales bacterium]
MKSVNPYLNFDGNTLEAFQFYKSVFGGDFGFIARFRDLGDNMGASGDELDRIAHISLPIAENTLLMGTDLTSSMPVTLNQGNNFYITLGPDDRAEAERLYGALSAGGEIEMGGAETEWAEYYASFRDKFGVQWMINYEGSKRMAG